MGALALAGIDMYQNADTQINTNCDISSARHTKLATDQVIYGRTHHCQDDPKEQTNPLAELLERASAQGFITYDEILETLPEVEERLDVLEDLFGQLREMDIPVQDQAKELEEEIELPPSRVISAKDEDDLALACDAVDLYFRQMGVHPR